MGNSAKPAATQPTSTPAPKPTSYSAPAPTPTPTQKPAPPTTEKKSTPTPTPTPTPAPAPIKIETPRPVESKKSVLDSPTDVVLWEKTVFQKHADLLEGLGLFLKGIGELVPIVGAGFRLMGFFTTYVGERARQNRDMMETIKLELETFLRDLEKTLDILNKYDEDDKRNSQLTLEIKVSLKTCYDWLEMMENKKMPENLSMDLKTRSESLKNSIARETLAQTIRIQQRTAVIEMQSRLDRKKPWEYYDDGKHFITEKKWMDAKTNFVFYRNFVESGTAVMSDDNPNGVKPPAADSHLKYLAYIQDQLNAQSKVNPDPILSVVPQNTLNQYTKLWDAWQIKYMGKK